MPVELPAEVNKEKNRMAAKSAMLFLLDFDIDGVDETLRFVNNNENIVYSLNTYHKMPFTLGKYDNTDTRLPERQLQISNADLINYILPYVEDYEGLVGATITVTPVNSDHLDIDMSSLACEFVVKSCSLSQQYIALSLGLSNPLNQRFPLDKYFAGQCRYYSRFKGIECGYSGEETECNGTSARCKELENLARFGGQIGLRPKTVRFV